jgi:hypothetical protein
MGASSGHLLVTRIRRKNLKIVAGKADRSSRSRLRDGFFAQQTDVILIALRLGMSLVARSWNMTAKSPLLSNAIEGSLGAQAPDMETGVEAPHWTMPKTPAR